MSIHSSILAWRTPMDRGAWWATVLGIASLAAQLIKNLPSLQETWFNSWVRKIPWRKDRLPTLVFLGLPGGSTSKESACNVGDLGSIPPLGRSPGEGHGNSLQYSCLENPHGQRSLVGYTQPMGHKVSGTTERPSTHKNGIPDGF